MILRRFSESLKQQNWVAICIEFVLLVAGVFLGIQVANWNAERETRQKAAIFTERLKADLREEAWSYQYLIEYSRDVLANAEIAVDALSGKAAASNEALLVSAYRATQYKQRTRRRSTYDELISTGTIGLIQDQRLRDTTMRLYNVPTIENTVREGATSRFREAFRMIVANDVQRALNKHCGDRTITIGDYRAIAGNLDYPCKLDLPQREIDEAANALRANAGLAPLLRLRIADLGTRVHDLTVNNRDIVQGLQAVSEDTP
ncbi:MAG: DUF6090 family protein [Lysobacter sp.]|nr:DUF6090 family protein [Lysobacter sp.]